MVHSGKKKVGQNRKFQTSDFNEIQYIGLFYPKNNLVKVKKLYIQNFSNYDTLKRGVYISKSIHRKNQF